MIFSLPAKSSIACIDVHAQKTFTPLCPDELPVPEGDQVAAELNAQAKFATKRIGVKEAHNPNAVWIANEEHPQLEQITDQGPNVDMRWVAHSVVGSKGFEFLDELPAPEDYDYFVWEGVELNLHPYGVCYHDQQEKLSTGVIEFMHYNNIDTVIVGGLATDYCVKASVLQLCKAGFNVIVNLAACRGLEPASTDQAINEMRCAGAKFVNSSAEFQAHSH